MGSPIATGAAIVGGVAFAASWLFTGATTNTANMIAMILEFGGLATLIGSVGWIMLRRQREDVDVPKGAILVLVGCLVFLLGVLVAFGVDATGGPCVDSGSCGPGAGIYVFGTGSVVALLLVAVGLWSLAGRNAPAPS